MAGSPQFNVLDDAAWQTFFPMIQDFQPHASIAIPPSNTCSRARRSSKRRFGPPPVRDFHFPHGDPWLSGRRKRQADEGNCFVNRAWDFFELAVRTNSFFSVSALTWGFQKPRPPCEHLARRVFSKFVDHGGRFNSCNFSMCFWSRRSATRFVTNLALLLAITFSLGFHDLIHGACIWAPCHSTVCTAAVGVNGSFNTALAATSPSALYTFLASGVFYSISVFPLSLCGGWTIRGKRSVSKRKGAPSHDPNGRI